MIDIHCHILHGIDDGPPDLETSVAMAGMAQADGITHIVCTPHIQPGIYRNSFPDIRRRVQVLRLALAQAGLNVQLLHGADIHLAPDLCAQLDDGRLQTLGASRAFLLEPPHAVMPPALPHFIERLLHRGYAPILTHPERFHWIEDHYRIVRDFAARGVRLQLTAGSVLGVFGPRPLYWSHRLLDEGLVDFIATDAHNLKGRPPRLAAARDAVAARLGEPVAQAMVRYRPAALLAGQMLPRHSPRPDLQPPPHPPVRAAGAASRLFGAAS